MWEFASNNPFWFVLMVIGVVAVIGDTVSNLRGSNDK